MNTHVANLESEVVPTGTSGWEVNVAGTVVEAGTLPNTGRLFLVGVKGASVRATFDGSDPVSAGVGYVVAQGNYLWRRERVAAVKMIESAGSAPAVVRFEPMGV